MTLIPILKAIEAERDRINERLRSYANGAAVRLMEIKIRLESIFYQLVDMYDLEREYRTEVSQIFETPSPGPSSPGTPLSPVS